MKRLAVPSGLGWWSYKRTETPKRFLPGDEIKLTLSISHEVNILYVEVVFVHSGSVSDTISFTGSPEQQRERADDGLKRSVAELSEVVLPEEHLPGLYMLQHVTFETFSERRVQYKGTDASIQKGDKVLEIAEEHSAVVKVSLALD